MSDPANQFQIRFWGVRGSIPCPGPATVRYGGNTPCVEMNVGGTRLIFDGGTGIRVLGQALLSQMPLEAHLFFTHSHWDHIQGFPFFVPAFVKGNRFHIYGAKSPNGATIKQRLHDQMLHPNFPVPLQIMQADLRFYNLDLSQPLGLGDVEIDYAPLNHPGDALGYRVSWRGLTAAYITDTEHGEEGLDANVLRLAEGADVVIIDTTYTDEEYHDSKSSKVGWGHSTWQEAVKVMAAARAKQLVLFHHDPLHNDDFLDDVAAQVVQEYPNACVAHEGQLIHLVPAV